MAAGARFPLQLIGPSRKWIYAARRWLGQLQRGEPGHCGPPQEKIQVAQVYLHSNIMTFTKAVGDGRAFVTWAEGLPMRRTEGKTKRFPSGRRWRR